MPPTQVTAGHAMRKTLVYLHDPEGNLIELCSYEYQQANRD